MTAPYYDDGVVHLWHGDCRELTAWLAADVLGTDPPYGRNWKQGQSTANGVSEAHKGIAGDQDTSTRDDALALWGTRRPGFMFGDLMLAPPPGTRQVCVYRKPPDAGHRGATGGYRRDIEAIALVGPWPSGVNGRWSSIITTATRTVGGTNGPAGRYVHPHAKPVDVLESLISRCPPGVIADPFAGSGSTLVAARNLGRRAVGVELEEAHCETVALRLAADVLPLGAM